VARLVLLRDLNRKHVLLGGALPPPEKEPPVQCTLMLWKRKRIRFEVVLRFMVFLSAYLGQQHLHDVVAQFHHCILHALPTTVLVGNKGLSTVV
jgi:hypothetical protein